MSRLHGWIIATLCLDMSLTGWMWFGNLKARKQADQIPLVCLAESLIAESCRWMPDFSVLCLHISCMQIQPWIPLFCFIGSLPFSFLSIKHCCYHCTSFLFSFFVIKRTCVCDLVTLDEENPTTHRVGELEIRGKLFLFFFNGQLIMNIKAAALNSVPCC